MSITAIIPYHSGINYLNLCLASLKKDRHKLSDIILISTNPQMNDGKFLQREGLRIIQYTDASGYADAVNRGARVATSDFLLFCDADVYFPERGWIDKHLALHHLNPRIGLTSSKLINYRTNRILDFGIGRTRFNHFHPCLDAPVSDFRACRSRRVQMACSAVMMISRSFFLEIGGFDETLRFHYQDVDLGLRLKQARKEVWVVADAPAYHRGSSAQINRQPFKLDERAYYAAKNRTFFEVDYATYLTESLARYEVHLASEASFGVINLSTMPDPNEALDIFNSYTSSQVLTQQIPSERDLETLALTDAVSYEIIRHPRPLVFLVDRYICLRMNALWCAARNTNKDLIVDRHANVRFFDELKNEEAKHDDCTRHAFRP